MSRQHLLQSHPGTSPVVGGRVFPRVLSPVAASPQVPLGSEEVQGLPGGEHTSLAGNRSSPGGHQNSGLEVPPGLCSLSWKAGGKYRFAQIATGLAVYDKGVYPDVTFVSQHLYPLMVQNC